MADKVLRKAGLFIAAGIMLVGLWLCLEDLEHGNLTGIFIAVAGASWIISDWSSFNQRRTKSKPGAQAARISRRDPHIGVSDYFPTIDNSFRFGLGLGRQAQCFLQQSY
jgi:hypothetical protein